MWSRPTAQQTPRMQSSISSTREFLPCYNLLFVTQPARHFAEPFEFLVVFFGPSAAPCANAEGGRRLRSEILRKARLRTREVLAHRHARRVRIMCGNGIADCPVLSQRRIPGFRILEIVRELGEVGIEPLVEQLADHANQHGIV